MFNLVDLFTRNQGLLELFESPLVGTRHGSVLLYGVEYFFFHKKDLQVS